ncbi:MAG: CPBP family intramembrane glutamic endopeptidase [Nitriliruptoraceae bacterium]
MTLLDGGVTLTLYFLGQLIVGFFAAALATVFGLRISGAAWAGVAVASTVAGFVLALGWLQLRGRLRDAVASAQSSHLLALGIGLAVGILGGMATYGINSLIGIFIAPEAPVEQQLLHDALGGGQALVIAVLIAVVIAPVAEEVLFRGVLFRALRRRVGLWPAALLSSLIFTGVHVEIVLSQPLALTGLFVFGVVLAWSLDRFQHLIVPIVAHAVFNGISLVLVVVLDRLGFTV